MRRAMFHYARNIALSAGVLLVSGPLVPSRARACSIDLSYLEFVSPVMGAVGVPTNAAIFVQGPATISADAIELVDADGALVSIEARRVSPLGFDIIPSAELLPNHDYTLWARWVGDTELPPGAMRPSRDKSIPFTTGPGPASVPAQLDPPELDVRVLQYNFGSCGLQTGTCVKAPRPPDTTLELLIDGEVVRADLVDPWPRYSGPLAADACIEVRVRDVRGNRSESSVACGERLERVWLPSDMLGVDYTCDNYESFLDPLRPADLSKSTPAAAGSASSGCALAPPGAGLARIGGFASILLALWVANRRRHPNI